jgi:hypothetical protein
MALVMAATQTLQNSTQRPGHCSTHSGHWHSTPTSDDWNRILNRGGWKTETTDAR